MRLIGLDIGTHTIGVAISDELKVTAQGLKTIRRKTMEEDLNEILTLISEYKIDKIVVGLPKNMDGTLGKQAKMVFQWIKNSKERITVPIVTYDERLTTMEASKVLLQADLSRKKRKRVIDKLSAILILQGYLNQGRK
ncbi:MAG: Holliday junction resolvase RuvX [Thermodesulfobacteriota bacterium]